MSPSLTAKDVYKRQGDIILALIVAAVVFFAVRSVFVKKSVGCSGDCAHCGGLSLIHI